MADANLGFKAQLGMGSAEPVTEIYGFTSESLTKNQEVVNTDGLRGTRFHIKERTRLGTYTVGGSIELVPTADELKKLFPRILGGAEQVDTPSAGRSTFALAETLPSFYIWVDKVAKVHKFSGCKVGRAVFRATQGGLLTLTLDVEGTAEGTPGAAGSFPSLTLDTDNPFMIFDASVANNGLVLNGTARQFREIEITIDNGLITDRFLNSQSRTEIPVADFTCTLRAVIPYNSDNTDLYGVAEAGIAGTAKFNNTAQSNDLLFTFGNLQFGDRTPPVPGRDEIFIEVIGEARKVQGTGVMPVSVQLDFT